MVELRKNVERLENESVGWVRRPEMRLESGFQGCERGSDGRRRARGGGCGRAKPGAITVG